MTISKEVYNLKFNEGQKIKKEFSCFNTNEGTRIKQSWDGHGTKSVNI